MSEAMKRIAAERQRQIEKEGWTPEHDAKHKRGDLARAGACYAVREYLYPSNSGAKNAVEELWPFDKEWDKRRSTSTIRGLEKAGALIAAELEKEIVYQIGWENFQEEFQILMKRDDAGCLILRCSCGCELCWYEGNLELVYEERYLGPCDRCGKFNDYTLDTGNEEEYGL